MTAMIILRRLLIFLGVLSIVGVSCGSLVFFLDDRESRDFLASFASGDVDLDALEGHENNGFFGFTGTSTDFESDGVFDGASTEFGFDGAFGDASGTDDISDDADVTDDVSEMADSDDVSDI